MKLFHGVGPALVTPFAENGEVDYSALSKLVEHVSLGKVDYLVVQGTTGESPTISFIEREKILENVKRANSRDLPILLGLGGNSTSQVVEAIKKTDFNGVDGILSVCPYYNKPTQGGLVAHFEAIARASPVPVILYNVPGRTSVNLEASSTIHLSRIPNIIGIKEASGDLNQCMAIQKGAKEGFLLISGDDMLTLPMISMGAVGVISVLANAFPDPFSRMIHLGLSGKFKEAAQISNTFLEINDLMYKEGNPTGVKAALNLLGVCSPWVRSPLLPASNELMQRLKGEIKKAAF